MKEKAWRAAPKARVKVAGMAARALTLVWLLPALAINLDWSVDGRADWNIAAAITIVATAVIFEAARHAKGRAWFTFLLVFGGICFLANVGSGFRNAVTRSGDSSDHARGEIEAAQRAADLRHRLIAQRAAAVKIAGDEPATDYQGQIETLKAGDARRWQATHGCDPDGGITLPESQLFCAKIQGVARQLGAAETRDKIDQQLADLDLQRKGVAAPAHVDPFAAKAAAIVPFDPAQIRLFFDALWALLPEVVAAVMPAVSLWLFERHGHQEPGARISEQYARAREAEGQGAPAPVEPASDHFAAFTADMLEPAQGERLSPAEALRLWRQWCARHGVEPQSQRWLGLRLGKAFSVEEKHKRKHYLHVRPANRLHLVRAA